MTHLVRRCTWDTTFDDATRGVELQDKLSLLSANLLPQILAESMDVMERRIRIPELVLDLGSIRYDELDAKLPGLLRTALLRGLADYAHAQSGAGSTAETVSVEDDPATSHAVLRYFLEHGDMPWWARGKTSHLAALEQEIAAFGARLVAMLRQVGKKETARKRMARQWKEQHLRKVVALLEPQHQRLIISFADKLCELHEEKPAAGMRKDAAFRQHRWFWILTHLLVERGTFFNTVAFVASTVRQMAAHFNLSYQVLLREIASATALAQGSELATPDFMRAIAILQKQATPQAPQPRDYWTLYQAALTRGNRVVHAEGRAIGFAELHAELAREHPERLAQLLRGQPPPGALRFLSATLPARQREELVRMLAGPHMAALRSLWRALAAYPASQTGYAAAVLAPTLAFLLATTEERFDIRAYARHLVTVLAGADEEMLTLHLVRYELARPGGNSGLAHALLEQVLERHAATGDHAPQRDTDMAQWLRAALRQYLETGTTGRHFPERSRRRRRDLLQAYLLDAATKPPYLLLTRTAAGRRATWARLLDLAGASAVPLLLERLCGTGQVFVQRLLDHWRESARKGLWSGELAHDCHHGFHLACLAAAHAVSGSFTPARFLDALAQALAAHGVMPEDAFVACMRRGLSAAGRAEWAALRELHAWTHVRAPQWSVDSPAASVQDAGADPSAATRAQSFSVLRDLLLHGRHVAREPEAGVLFRAALRENPARLRALLREHRANDALVFRLTALVDSVTLLEAVAQFPPRQEGEARMLKAFVTATRRAPLQGIADKDLELVFRETVLRHWMRAKGGSRFASAVARNVMAQLLLRRRVQRQHVLAWLEKIARHIPARLLAELKSLLLAGSTRAVTAPRVRPGKRPAAAPRPKPALLALAPKPEAPLDSLGVRNAGLVLLGDYIKPYFQRLGLTQGDAFVSDDARLRAVHYLQFLATGATETEEQHLKLNKLLCGLALEEPVPAGIELANGEAQLAESLLQAMIGYWKAIGTCSLDGFRGNWLVRDGTLAEQDDRWSLAIAKRSYDVLLNKAPFGFSVIRYPWMPKAVYTAWSY